MDREKIYKEAVKFRRYFHQHPEVSMKEFRTQAYIVEILKQYQIAYTTYEAGIIAILGEGKRCVALRADMDALWVQEDTGLSFSSENPGVMHACGHDMHMAMLLGAALFLKAREQNLGGVVKLVFQPSEEKRPGGARLLLPYVMEAPKPEAIFGQHIFPGLPVGTIGIRSGAFFASSDNIVFTVEGKGTHAAMPQMGSDPILAVTALIQFYQTIVTKFRNPLTPAVLSITSVHGGTANNVIPDRVEVKGTVRTHDNELRRHIFELIHEKSPAICDLYGCCFVPDMFWNGLPVLVNDSVLTGQVKRVGEQLPVVDKVVEMDPLTLGEDFAIYLEELPGAFWTLGVCAPETGQMSPLHNPGMSPDERAIPVGIEMLVANCLEYFSS